MVIAVKLTLSKLAVVTGATLHGADTTVHDIGIDSRALKPKSLFVAIKGEQFDGHNFIAQAQGAGAIALLVERLSDSPLPQLVVSDARIALGLIAGYQRREFSIPVIGVTGSCGKTTTKSLIASVLAQAGRTLATQGTLNNDIGVPLTLFNLGYKHDFAVIEMGANHPGEIAYLTNMVRPTIGVITNAAPVHLEGFGSLEGVAAAKAELYQHLPVDGVAILNIDDAQQAYWRNIIGARSYLTYGLKSSADVFGDNASLNDKGLLCFTLHHNGDQAIIKLPLLGMHNIHNALAAAAVGFSLGLSMKTIQKGLQKAEAMPKRINRLTGIHQTTLIDDSYNANPTAFKVAINLLCQFEQSGERVLIMGDMAELGADTEKWHADVGHFAKTAGITRLLTVGALSANASHAFGPDAEHFSDQDHLIAHLKQTLTPHSIVLIKGSRSARMENIVSALKHPSTLTST